MEDVNVPDIVRNLSGDDDAARKMAAFKLQSVIGDPSFADIFLSEHGLPKLRALVLHSGGNTLAYVLACFNNLLQLDLGWDAVDSAFVERLVHTIVGDPIVNILRGAMAVLAAIVSHPPPEDSQSSKFGFRALRPAINRYPEFLEILVTRMSSADHLLSVNVMQLINSLMRDALTIEGNEEWPLLFRRLQDLGVVRAVYVLMQSSNIQDMAQPLLDFQSLTKAVLRKWREIPVDLDQKDHRRALKLIYQAANPDRKQRKEQEAQDGVKSHDPEKWRRLGFEAEAPGWEFEDVGYLGMMDLSDYVNKNEDAFHKILLEQSTKPSEKRCPIAKASIAVTSILYDHFEVDQTDSEEQQRYIALESRGNFDRVFKPLLLQWSKLHTASLKAFIRLWSTTDAESDDFQKVEDLIRILVEQAVGLAARTKDITEVEQVLASYDMKRLRDLQMELFDLAQEDAWGHHLRQVKDELQHEALQFLKEQRVRCLLQGSWFPNPSNLAPSMSGNSEPRASSWRFVRLSHNRRYLRYDDFDEKLPIGEEPSLDALDFKIDLNIVTSVVSNVSPSSEDSDSRRSSTSTIRSPSRHGTRQQAKSAAHTNIVIHGVQSRANSALGQRKEKGHKRNQSSISTTQSTDSTDQQETALLTLHPTSTMLASEWLDGLLLLLNQTPITTETNKLIEFIAKYGLKMRLLNVRFEEALSSGMGSGAYGKEVKMPERDGLDEDFYYDIGGA